MGLGMEEHKGGSSHMIAGQHPGYPPLNQHPSGSFMPYPLNQQQQLQQQQLQQQQQYHYGGHQQLLPTGSQENYDFHGGGGNMGNMGVRGNSGGNNSGFSHLYPSNHLSDPLLDDLYGHMGGVGHMGGWEGIRQDPQIYIESDEDDEKDLEYLETTAKYQEALSKVEKEFSQRMINIAAQRDKAEETFKKEFESLTARKEDLDKQLEIMQVRAPFVLC